MSNEKIWVNKKIRLGWFFVILGILFSLVGIAFEIFWSFIPYNVSIITGLGILWLGIGIGIIVKYYAAKKDSISVKRLMIEEQDERNTIIKFRAGYRGFWVSIIMVYILLLWLSLASNGSLPPIEKDLLWYIQAACVIIPFSVYVISFLIDQKKI